MAYNKSNMNEIEFLNKKLTTEELDKFLYEIMGYHAVPYEFITRYYKVTILMKNVMVYLMKI